MNVHTVYKWVDRYICQLSDLIFSIIVIFGISVCLLISCNEFRNVLLWLCIEMKERFHQLKEKKMNTKLGENNTTKAKHEYVNKRS